MLKWNLDSCWGMVDITGPYLCHRKRITSLEIWDKTISNGWKYLEIYIKKQKPEHCHRVQTKGRPRVSSFWALRSTLSQISEQCRVSCIPAIPKKKERCKQNLLRRWVKQECYEAILWVFFLITFGFVMWGGQYGYIMVSKFGRHHVATHSPTCSRGKNPSTNYGSGTERYT